MSQDNAKDQKVSYKDTLNLPQTDFPIRPNAKKDDPDMLQRWQSEELCEKAMMQNEGDKKYILHDGPPYANGNIHLGHAYNKVLKDFITKSRRMEGFHTPVTPGWDCHGLPIELKVVQEKGHDLSRAEFKKACREYAKGWIDIQRSEFKKLGVLMDWENPYLTMNYDYEANILRAFGEFVEKKYIEKKNKTVAWCASCTTVLASAEIEYEERKDPSIYVLFPLQQDAVSELLPDLAGKDVNLLVWTTTPWTLPLNRGVVLKPNTKYQVLEHEDVYFIVGAELADAVCSKKDISKKVVAEFNSNELVSKKAHHPFVEDLIVPIITDHFVSLTDGTACVHSAPGCGPEDYELGVKNNLEIYSPLSPDGKYTTGIMPTELEGMPVVDGQIWVLRKLAEKGRMFAKTSIRHPYPHCWRCRNGLIFRATTQWFCNLSQEGLKEKTLEELDKVKFIPERSKNSLHAAIDSRLEWCLSRQRTWGVPITALLCNGCDLPYITPELIEKVAQGIEKEGTEYWDHVEIADLVSHNLQCMGCDGKDFRKEMDILDVWFDSGVSHYAVLMKMLNKSMPADIYLEGRDQARGWFQSSALTGVVLEGMVPTKAIATHGFTVDKKGLKMSKSRGNVVLPQEMVDDMGTDGLRLWVSSNDFTNDAIVSPELIKNVKEVFRKIRNTLRFLVSNLYDFDIKKDAIELGKLHAIDQFALSRLDIASDKVRAAYGDCKFTTVFHELADYCSADLSALYLDIIKDRLYTGKKDGESRRAAQTVCWYVLDTLNKLVAPVLSFTAEQVSDCYQSDKKESVHLQRFADIKTTWQSLAASLEKEYGTVSEWQSIWTTLFKIREAQLKAIEGLREQGDIKHSLGAKLQMTFDRSNKDISNVLNYLNKVESNTKQTPAEFFKEFVVVSQVEVADGAAQSNLGLDILVTKAAGEKCPRCWKFDMSDHEHNLCNECQSIIS